MSVCAQHSIDINLHSKTVLLCTYLPFKCSLRWLKLPNLSPQLSHWGEDNDQYHACSLHSDRKTNQWRGAIPYKGRIQLSQVQWLALYHPSIQCKSARRWCHNVTAMNWAVAGCTIQQLVKVLKGQIKWLTTPFAAHKVNTIAEFPAYTCSSSNLWRWEERDEEEGNEGRENEGREGQRKKRGREGQRERTRMNHNNADIHTLLSGTKYHHVGMHWFQYHTPCCSTPHWTITWHTT